MPGRHRIIERESQRRLLLLRELKRARWKLEQLEYPLSQINALRASRDRPGLVWIIVLQDGFDLVSLLVEVSHHYALQSMRDQDQTQHDTRNSLHYMTGLVFLPSR